MVSLSVEKSLQMWQGRWDRDGNALSARWAPINDANVGQREEGRYGRSSSPLHLLQCLNINWR